MRLINADELINAIADFPYGYRGMIKNVIAEQPTVEERKRGKWIIRETAFEDTEAKCSVCGFVTLVNEPGNGLHMVSDLNYCPKCGAVLI